MQQVVDISTGYHPRPLQLEIHRKRKRFTVLAIHRRFGKTVLAVNELIDAALKCKLHNPRMAYIAPYYKQAKSVAWAYLKDFCYNIPNIKIYESELRVDIPVGFVNGKPSIARIQLFGSDSPDSLRGLYFDQVVLDEFGNMPVSLWNEVLRPALADRKGGCMFLGTPNGKNHFYEKFREATKKMQEGHPEWYAATYRADETKLIDQHELESARENMPESDYRQEFLCDWAAAVKGAFYADEMNKVSADGRILNIPYERGLPVYCAFDLGIDDQTAVWFVQFFRNEVRLIDYQEWTDTGLIDVLKDIKDTAYVIEELIMPWDITIREVTSGMSRREIVEDLGYDVIVAPKLSIEDGIGAVRKLLYQCYFDKDKTQRGIDCLENYRKKWDGRTSTFLLRPEHDEYSHGADAFRYLALGYDPTMGEVMGSKLAKRSKKRVRKCT